MPPPNAHSRTRRSEASAPVIRTRSATRSFFAAAGPVLQVLRRVVHRPPHVRRRTVIEAQAFLRLLEVTTDHVRELLELHVRVGIECVEIVHCDEARSLITRVLTRVLVGFLNVRLGLRSEERR